LTTLTKLESLKLRSCILVNNNGWQLTDKLPNLTSFTARSVDDASLSKLIVSCPNLKYLHLAGSSVLNITELPKLTNLTYLNLSSTKITMNLTVLKQMTRLTELNLADIPPSRILPEILASLTNLVSLNIAGNSQLVSNSVGILTQIGNLEYLNIEGATSVDGDVIPYLDRFLRLKHLRRNGTKLPSSVEVRYFVKNGLMRNK
jgi:Leucine-rich repeat (LRR) protein